MQKPFPRHFTTLLTILSVDLGNKSTVQVILVSKNVLIVIADDDVDDQLFMRHAFERNNFAGMVECVGDGNKLIDYLREANEEGVPGLVLLDLNMPLKDGYQALAEIKRDPTLSNIPVAVITSSSRPEDEPECYKLGCERFYRKPISVEEYDQLAYDLMNYVESK